MLKVGFDGTHRGLLVRPTPQAVSQAYVRDALNLIMVGGRPRSRPGWRPAHGAAFADPVRGGGTHYRPDGTRDYLVCAGDKVYRMPLYGDPEELSLDGLPTTERTRVDPVGGVRFLSLSGGANTTFLVDGVNPNLSWRGTALHKMGLPTPTAPAAPTPDAGTAIGAGTRDYYRTVRSAVHESELSTATRVVQGTTGGQSFASPVDGADYDDPQVTSWSLYRTQDGLAKRFLVGSADIGLPILDHLSDEVLGAKAVAEQLVNTPPTGLFVQLVEHLGLCWGFDTTDRNLMRFSYGTAEYMAPEGWPEERVVPVAHGDGDEITAAVSFYEWLVVFKQLSTWAIIGGLDEGFKVIPVLAAAGGTRQGIGCIAPGGILHKENELVFPSRDGFYQIERFAGVQAGINATKISDAIDSLYDCTNFARGAAALYDRGHQTYFFFGHGGAS